MTTQQLLLSFVSRKWKNVSFNMLKESIDAKESEVFIIICDSMQRSDDNVVGILESDLSPYFAEVKAKNLSRNDVINNYYVLSANGLVDIQN